MAYELVDIVKPSGSNSQGMSETILIADRNKVLSFPPTTISPAVPGDTLRLEGDITFDEDEGFVKVYATQDTVQLMLTPVGQKDSRGWNVNLDFWCPGLNAPFAELLAADPDLVALVKRPECDDSEWVCLGNTCRGVGISGEYDSALSNDESGRNGWSGKISGFVPQYYFYSGEVTMKGEVEQEEG